MTWTVELSKAARRALAAVHEPDLGRLRRTLHALAGDPRPFGVKTLGAGILRIRAGDWRIIYHPNDAARTLQVLRIVRRNERTYRRL